MVVGYEYDEIMNNIESLLMKYKNVIYKKTHNALSKMESNFFDDDDILQMIRIKMWKSWAKAKNPKNLMFKIVWSVCCDALRYDKRRPPTEYYEEDND